ncbi:hypothetical protein [Clostridium tyrobutyricum]|jgi:uncharacterized OsmC-like protein|nr:hypothetical protein [Clostridium tyrobutyricum]
MNKIVVLQYIKKEKNKMGKIKVEFELEEISDLKNLIKSRINELRIKMSNDPDKEEELKQIIRSYKRIINSIEDQIK